MVAQALTAPVRRKSLYAIAQDIEALDDILMDVGGDISDEQAEAAVDAWLVENEKALSEKADAYMELVRENEGRAMLYRDEAARLLSQAKVFENSANRLKNRLKMFLNRLGVKKLVCQRFIASVCNNGGKLPVTLHPDLLGTKNPENHIPKEFLRVKYEVDTDKVRDALAEGQELGWATLGERGDHLRIK